MTEEPRVCIKALRGPILAATLRSGRAPDKLAIELGLTPEQLFDPTARVPHSVANAAYNRLAELCDEPGFGLFTAQVVGGAPIDFVDYALLHSPNVRAMVESYVRYQSLFHDANETMFVEEATRVCWVHSFASDLPTSRHLIEFIFGMWILSVRRATKAVVPLKSVELRHKPPADRALYAVVFGADVDIVFDAKRNALGFEPSVMDLPVVASDATMHEMFSRQVEQALGTGGSAERSDDFVNRVRRALMKLLPHGNADADRVATALDISTRTLHRHLAEKGNGIAFRQLLDEVRSSFAKNQLARGDVTVTDIAFLLGYSDLTAFSRAFRRWTGKSPAEFRRAG